MSINTHTILVVDDDKLTRMACKKILKHPQITVLEAENGNTGLALFKEAKPSLIIIDILMPEKEGLQTINEMRAISHHIPIVAISGGGGVQDLTFLQAAKAVGASHTLPKPVKPHELLKIINQCLKL